MSGEVGRTKDAGWQIGVSRTIDHPIEQVWEFLTSAAGTALWLGHGVDVVPEKGSRYKTTDGTAGEFRSFHPHDRIRLTWQPAGWDHPTTVQVAVRPNGPDRTMLRFHQERLADAEERAQQREHWREVMQSVVEALQKH